MASGSWEKIYNEQGEVQHEILNTVAEAKELFQNNNFHNVLDLGCGTGRNTIFLADAGFKVWACDISPPALEITKNKAEKLGLKNICFAVEDMFSLSYGDSLFDAILCVWVQGHGTKKEIQKSIDEQFRILKDRGMIITDFVTRDDESYGIGEEIEPNTFVGGREGEEGITHYYTCEKELKEMYSKFSSVELTPRIYSYNDVNGQEHYIKAIVVHAIK